jgi:hypothetical protein
MAALDTLIPDTPKEDTILATGSKTAVPKGPYALPTGGGVAGVDPALLENMQKLIAERETQKNSFLESMKDANAWWSGGVAGPGEALRARAKDREEQEATTFGMKSQIAQYKAQQALAQRTQQNVMGALGGGTPGTPGAGGGFGTQIDPAIANQIRDLAQTDPAAAQKLLQEHTKKMSEYTAQARMNPKSYEKSIEVRRADGKLELVSLVELLNSPQKYQPTESGAVEVQTQTGGVVPGVAKATTGSAEAIAKEMGIPIISGNRDLAKQTELYNASLQPGYKGPPVAKPGTSKHEIGNAIDVDMKSVTPQQIADLKSKGFTQPLPDKDPNHWELTTAPATVAVPSTSRALPHTQPLPKVGAPEQTPITAPSAAAPAAPAPVAAPVAAPRAPAKPITEKTIPELRAEQEVATAYQKESGTQYAKNVMEDEKAFRSSTEAKSVAERKTSAERVVDLVTKNPKSVGILAEPGVANALFTLARDGINTPSGAAGMKTIEDALILTMPGGGQKAINARKEVAQNLARGALEASKLSQGQGSVSDFERTMFEKIAGSLADTPELLIKRQKMLIARAELDQKLGNMYRQVKTPGKPADYEAFKSRDDVAGLIDKYEEELRTILATDIVLNKSSAAKHPGTSLLDKYPQKAK